MQPANIPFTNAIDPRSLPETRRITMRLEMDVFRKVLKETADRYEYAFAIRQVLSDPIAVFESVHSDGERQVVDGWIFVGVPGQYLVPDPADRNRTTTRTFPSNSQLVVWVDSQDWVYKWFKSRVLVDDEGELLHEQPGFGRCLYPSAVLQ